ncbi:preprotein translocase subunit SecG [Tenericutes bacterium MO-XQ]|jgi:preprotein translocase subunit SecG|nr:preprotein translocase subunit SecG [Tenericutes bacterium MO-XQ]
MIWVDWIAIISTILLIIAVLLQSSDDNIQDAFSGEKSELFKNKKIRGMELFLTRASIILSILMVVSVILSNNLR